MGSRVLWRREGCLHHEALVSRGGATQSFALHPPAPTTYLDSTSSPKDPWNACDAPQHCHHTVPSAHPPISRQIGTHNAGTQEGILHLAVLGCCCLLCYSPGTRATVDPRRQSRNARRREVWEQARGHRHDISARSWPVAPTPLCTCPRSALVRRLLHLQLSSLHVCMSRSRPIQHDMCERPPFGAKGRTMT
jgi:hypothetical protein